MLKSKDRKEYMTDRPITLTRDANIFTAIHVLLVNKVSGVTIVDEEQNLLGVLSEVDCLRAILDGSYYGVANGTVGDYMTTNVETISPEVSIADVASALVSGDRRRLPVVENGKFVGQFSVRSILKAVKDFNVPTDETEKTA